MTSATVEHDLASRFCRILNEWLTTDEIAEINSRNQGEYAGRGLCATHDFCDPNQAMLDAMEELGIELDVQDEKQIQLIDEAWSLAKAAGFDGEKLETN